MKYFTSSPDNKSIKLLRHFTLYVLHELTYHFQMMVNSGKRFLFSQKIINYSSYLQKKDNFPIDKQILLMTKDLHHAGKSSCYFNIITLSEFYNLPCFNVTCLTNGLIKHSNKSMSYTGNMPFKTLIN